MSEAKVVIEACNDMLKYGHIFIVFSIWILSYPNTHLDLYVPTLQKTIVSGEVEVAKGNPVCQGHQLEWAAHS
jgi:hypothetical protein